MTVPRGVLFDLDGTLVDTAPSIAQAVNRVLMERRLPVQPEAVVRGWIGGGMETLLQRSLRALGMDAEDRGALGEFVTAFRVHYRACLGEGAAPYPDMPELLEHLDEAGSVLAIVTNKPREFAEPLLQRLGLDTRFRAMVCGDDLARSKPDPLPVTTLLNTLQLTPTDTWLVGDSIADMRAAQAAGVPAVLMAYGYGSDDPEARALAAAHAADVAQLRAVLCPR
ncbi:MAG: phosphoglycolate phosphatase [Gammaproteobacteria bacterium]|nr:phosphoglycolate phosphatase [Gammaproteobacteria bacterium]